MQLPAVPRATSWLSLPWVLALLQTFTVVADSTPVRGLVSVALCAGADSSQLPSWRDPSVSHLQGKVTNDHHPKVLAPCRGTGRHSNPACGVRRRIQRRRRWRRSGRRRDHADAGRLRRARTRLEQDHPGVRRDRRGQGRRSDHVLRRVGRPVARRRRRQASRPRQPLGRARRHQAGQGRQGGQGLERGRHQGHPVRLGRTRWLFARATRRTSTTGTTCCSPGSRSSLPAR